MSWRLIKCLMGGKFVTNYVRTDKEEQLNAFIALVTEMQKEMKQEERKENESCTIGNEG